MIDKTGLSEEIVKTLRDIFSQYSLIEKVKIYGSRAKGTFNSRSDIDLVIYGKNIDRFLISEILLTLDDSNIPYLMDMQNYSDIKNLKLLDHIDRIGLLFYEK